VGLVFASAFHHGRRDREEEAAALLPCLIFRPRPCRPQQRRQNRDDA
jgi:hypothetical protein